LRMTDRIPAELLDHSGLLQEVIGIAGLQASDLSLAFDAFNKAQKLYQTAQDETALNRLQFLIAEARLNSGEMQPEDFVKAAHDIASHSYEQNNLLFAAQVELRSIEIGQTIAQDYAGMLEDLTKRS
jgi:multidrug efflux pump subunit AcrA (membrane-fusion protein)